MKKLFVLLSILLLTSCFSSTNYRYEYEIKIIYITGDTEVLTANYDSFNGNEVHLNLVTSTNGLITSSGTSPCLCIGCGFYTKVIACDIRRYEVLKLKKVKL